MKKIKESEEIKANKNEKRQRNTMQKNPERNKKKKEGIQV
jgi:hypothetical protein